MKLAIYTATLPPKARHSPEKTRGFAAFIAGAKRHGVEVVETSDHVAVPSDIGLMFSFVDMFQRDAGLIPYMKTRKRIFEKTRNLFFFENDVLKDFNNTLVMRFPFRSVYDHETEYFLQHIPEGRVDSEFGHIQARAARESTRSKHVVITLNRLGGYGRCGVAQFEWAYNLVKDLRNTDPTQRIKIRLHPGNANKQGGIKFSLVETDRMFHKALASEFPDVKIYLPERGSYLNDLNFRPMHIFNTSSASCESILRGARTVVTHPAAFAWDFAPHAIESPRANDPKGLLRKYKKTHFTPQEVESGLYWDYIKEGVKEVI